MSFSFTSDVFWVIVTGEMEGVTGCEGVGVAEAGVLSLVGDLLFCGSFVYLNFFFSRGRFTFTEVEFRSIKSVFL